MTLHRLYFSGDAGGAGLPPRTRSAPAAGGTTAVFDLSLDLPAGCPPGSANDKGVGIPCTRGGGECRSGHPHLCRATRSPVSTLLNGVPCICTVAGLNPEPNNPSPARPRNPRVGQTQPAATT